jgi:hypothetical protein
MAAKYCPGMLDMSVREHYVRLNGSSQFDMECAGVLRVSHLLVDSLSLDLRRIADPGRDAQFCQ